MVRAGSFRVPYRSRKLWKTVRVSLGNMQRMEGKVAVMYVADHSQRE